MWKSLALSTILVNLFLIVCADIDPATVSDGTRANDIGIIETVNVTPKKCAINEKFETCPENRCQPQICEHVGFPQCTSHEEKYFHGKEEIYKNIGYNAKCGPPACVCIDNYVRNKEGVCIPATLCPSCGNDKNATFGCGLNCGRRCSNYNKKTVKCAQVCYVNSCDCKVDYVFDDYTGFCVLPQDCSNKDAPEPEGDDGSSEDNANNDSTGNVSNDDPCGKCDKENCDVEDMKDNKLDGGETCEVKESSNKDKNATEATSTKQSEASTTPKSGTSTKTSEEKNTTENPGTIKTTKPETTTADSKSTTQDATTEEPDSTTKKKDSWLENIKNIFTGKIEEPSTTSESSESTTKNTTKTTATPNSEASTTSKSETSTKTGEGSSQSSTTSTRTQKPETTQKTEKKTTTKQPDTTKTTKPQTTTTTADCALTTQELDTTTTEKPDSTTKKEDSWLEHKINKTDKPCKKDCKLTTTTEKTEITSVTTERTTKSSEDCQGKHELYACASSCPQLSCAEYLNGMRCHAKTKPKKCKPECRCRAGYYRDNEENCVSAWDCRRTSNVKPTTPDPSCEDEALELFIKGNLAYTVKILQELSLSRPGSNVVFAGASILTLTSELALLATGNTKKQLLSAVHFNEREQIRCFFPNFIANYTEELRYIELNFYTEIYADEQCQLSEDFKRTTTEIFSSTPQNIDFTSPESAKQISETVAQNTNDKIQNFITTETLSKFEKGLLLLDAQSFKGQLEKPFDPAHTKDRDFFGNGEVVKKPTMKQKGIFMYTESLFGTKMVSLNYKKGKPSEDYKLVIILPISKHGHKHLMKQLANPDVLLSALDKMRPELVEIYLPIINVTAANKLKMPSKKANMDLIFNKHSSGLKHIADCETPVVKEILQRCVLEVNESGIENHWDSGEGGHQNKLKLSYLFKANHPFFYAVFSNRIMLFAGIYAH